MKPTCYHLRRVSDNLKVVSGSLPRSLTTLDAAAEWLSERAPVVVSPTGNVQFTYGGGTPVYAYLSVDPAETAQGQEQAGQAHAYRRQPRWFYGIMRKQELADDPIEPP